MGGFGGQRTFKEKKMILILEQDTRKRNGKRFTWKPKLWKFPWHGKRSWRFGWGVWSLTYCPEPGLRDFHDHIAEGNTKWRV